MTLGGWIIMIISVGSASLLFVWCVVRVLSKPGTSSHLKAPLDALVQPPDRSDNQRLDT